MLKLRHVYQFKEHQRHFFHVINLSLSTNFFVYRISYGISFWYLSRFRDITYLNGWFHLFESVISLIRMCDITRSNLRGWYYRCKKVTSPIRKMISPIWKVISPIRMGDITGSFWIGVTTHSNRWCSWFERVISPIWIDDITFKN